MISQKLFKSLETHGLAIKAVRFFSVPLLNNVPERWLRFAMSRTSHDAATVVAHGGSTTALEAMYTRHHRRPFSRGFFQGIVDYFWHHVISQPKALRNRLKIVESLLEEEIAMRASLHDVLAGPISILNVAGGSSRAVIQVLSKLKETRGVAVTSIDKDERAIALGKRLAVSAGVAGHFRWIQGNVRDLEQFISSERFNIIEVVGLLDYFTGERFIAFLEILRRHLADAGTLILANVIPNDEIPFVRKTGWPEMFYRRPEEVRDLIAEAGFGGDSDIIVEPLGIHAVIRVRV